jgi:hypothetical protein
MTEFRNASKHEPTWVALRWVPVEGAPHFVA